MSSQTQELETLATSDYKFGWVTDIEQESAPPGLNEDIFDLYQRKKMNPTGCSNGA